MCSRPLLWSSTLTLVLLQDNFHSMEQTVMMVWSIVFCGQDALYYNITKQWHNLTVTCCMNTVFLTMKVFTEVSVVNRTSSFISWYEYKVII